MYAKTASYKALLRLRGIHLTKHLNHSPIFFEVVHLKQLKSDNDLCMK